MSLQQLRDQTPHLLSTIDSVFPTLAESVQKTLLAGLRNPSELDDAFYEALHPLVDASPTLAAFASSLNTNAKLVPIMGPLLLWALSKPWSRDIALEGLTSYIHRWTIKMGGSRYAADPRLGLFVLSTMTPMLDMHLQMSSAKKRKLLTSVYNSVREISGLRMLILDTHRHHSGIDKLFETLTVQMGFLAQRCCGQEMLNDRLVSDVWACDVAALSSPEPCTPFLLHVLTNPLSDAYKRNVCSKLEPRVWLQEDMAPYISALLPQNEHMRLQQLPWTWNAPDFPYKASQMTKILANAEWNQQLAKMYCPRLYPLIDLVVSNEQWGDKETILTHARVLSKPANRAYELPSNLELSL